MKNPDKEIENNKFKVIIFDIYFIMNKITMLVAIKFKINLTISLEKTPPFRVTKRRFILSRKDKDINPEHKKTIDKKSLLHGFFRKTKPNTEIDSKI